MANPVVAHDEGLRRGMRTLAYELTMAEARERGRIARELHDDIGQLLAVARFKVLELRDGPADERNACLDELGELLEQAARATRSATFDLSCPALALGLDEALRSLAQRLHRNGGPLIRVEGEMPPTAWSEPVLSVLYRVVRELVVNAQRHARARLVRVCLSTEGSHFVVSVADDGIGIGSDWAARGVSPDGGFGLVSAHAQMQALGGTLVLESGSGSGTEATATLPLQRAVQT